MSTLPNSRSDISLAKVVFGDLRDLAILRRHLPRICSLHAYRLDAAWEKDFSLSKLMEHSKFT
jgi:hypothetical protein